MITKEKLLESPELSFYLGDTELVCAGLPAEGFSLIHSDLPFNTGKVQKGSAGKYEDRFDDFASWLRRQVVIYRKLLAPNGTIALQLDDREYLTLRTVCDSVLGESNYRGTIVWHYDTGGISKNWWSMKHQYIVLYGSGKIEPTFHADQVPLVPRKSLPKKVVNAAGEEKIYGGDKKLCSVWNLNWSTTDPERCGYPSQKPSSIAENLIRVHTNEGEWVLDPCCGSATTGFAAHSLGRNSVVVDKNPEALAAARSRAANKRK